MIKEPGHRYLFILAVLGLFFSSFSLLVLQGVMDGLQEKVVGRSRDIMGHYTVTLKQGSFEMASELKRELKEKWNLDGYLEIELDLLLISDYSLTPVIIHGIENFTEDGLILSKQISRFKLHSLVGDQLTLLSPGYVDSFLGDIPRTTKIKIAKTIETFVPEIDAFHVWASARIVQNLIRERFFNRMRFFSPIKKHILEEIRKKYSDTVIIHSWEEMNSTLVFALKLESMILTFLFTIMGILVSLGITSGLAIFFDKIKNDLITFWILGSSKLKLTNASHILLFLMSFFSITLGVLLGILGLYLFDQYGGQIMPDIFVDRKIPVELTLKGALMAFSIPFVITMLFSLSAMKQFKENDNYLKSIKAIS